MSHERPFGPTWTVAMGSEPEPTTRCPHCRHGFYDPLVAGWGRDIEFTVADCPLPGRHDGKTFFVNGVPYRLISVGASEDGALTMKFERCR